MKARPKISIALDYVAASMMTRLRERLVSPEFSEDHTATMLRLPTSLQMFTFSEPTNALTDEVLKNG